MEILSNNVSLILMDQDNNGNDLSSLNSSLERKLIKAFGGCTVTPARGLWMEGGQTFVDRSHVYECDYKGALTDSQFKAVSECISAEMDDGGQLAVSVKKNSQLAILDGSSLESELKQLKSWLMEG